MLVIVNITNIAWSHFSLIVSRSEIVDFYFVEGQLARQLYENRRRQAAALRIQTYSRMQVARKAYRDLYFSSLVIQAGLRGMAARKELHFRRQTSAATIIQV